MSENHACGTVWEHLEELRQTLFRVLGIIAIGVVFALLFYQQLFSLLVTPFGNLAVESSPQGKNLVILSPTEGLLTTFKVAFWAGAVGSSPFWILLVMRFVSPALERSQGKKVFSFFLLALLFLFLGGCFALFITMPLANSYLYAFNSSLGVNFWSLSQYLDYTIILLLSNSLAFEFCVILLLLVHFGRLSAEKMKEKRRYAIVCAFLLAAVLTPPDILTQLLLAIPLSGIYELAILYAKIREQRVKNKKFRMDKEA